jgi:hypothetical protein
VKLHASVITFPLQLHKNSLKDFTRALFSQVRGRLFTLIFLRYCQCELLAPYAPNVDAIYAAFLRFAPLRSPLMLLLLPLLVLLAFLNFELKHCDSYKLTVPTYGCALIDPSRSSVLLVKGFGRNRCTFLNCLSR